MRTLYMLIGVLALTAYAERPNIVLVLVDDLGYSDFGCYGGEIRTPNIDALAAGGLRFTQFYNTARCCPTRAALLTGLYPHQVGLKINGQSLTRDGATIAELLGHAGYQTAMAGKWHLSKTPVLKEKHQEWLDHQFDPGLPFGPIETYPLNRGFQKFYGIIWGVVNYWDPFSLVEGVEAVRDVPEDFYMTDAITAKSVSYIGDMAKSEAPFFMYVAHCAPHWPLHARPEDIARYEGRYSGGFDQLRQERFARQVKLGIVDPEITHLTPVMGGGKAWSELDDETRRYLAQKMAVHAAMVDRVDQSVGKIVEALKAAGRFENTVILILSDNGASPEVPGGPGYDRTGATREGGVVKYKNIPVAELGSESSYTGFGPQWANAVNTPWRYWKKESFEGGNHTPFIVHWPAGLKAAAGSLTDQLGHVTDITPTCLELAGVAYPASFNGNAILPLEGRSLVPIVAGGRRSAPEALYFEHEGGRAIRAGDWKLVALRGKPWELYNLARDRNETVDLAAQSPEKVASLDKLWTAWAQRVGADVPDDRSGRKGK